MDLHLNKLESSSPKDAFPGQVEIGTGVLEKKVLKFFLYFHYFVIIILCKECGPSFEQKLNSLYKLKILSAKFG